MMPEPPPPRESDRADLRASKTAVPGDGPGGTPPGAWRRRLAHEPPPARVGKSMLALSMILIEF
jgi:hypothetical protein